MILKNCESTKYYVAVLSYYTAKKIINVYHSLRNKVVHVFYDSK